MINDKQLKAWLSSPPDKTIEQVIGHGLAVRASKTGVISFYFRYRDNGKDKRITLGNYPVITLKMAKDETMRLAVVYQQGGNVVDAANTRHKTHNHLPTVKQCIDKYLDTYGNLLRPSSVTMYRTTLEKHLAPYFDKPAEKIRMDEWLRLLDGVVKNSSANTSAVVLRISKRCFGWCIRREIIASCNVMRINTPDVAGVTIPERDRVMDMQELAQFWQALARTKLSLPVRNCIKLLILTGARNSEIREATWDEFDLAAGIWILPPHRSKTGDTIRRPLSTEAIRLLQELKSAYPTKWVIPSSDANLQKPITTHSIARAVSRIRAKLKIAHFVPHDFRRTIATRLAEQGVAPHVTEKMLGHKLGGIMAIYNRHDWIDEQREAYELWQRHLCSSLMDVSF